MSDSGPNITDAELLQAGYRYALSLTHHSHNAEDLIQQACLRLFKSRGGFVSKSYLFTAIRNLHTDAHRRRQHITIEPLIDDEMAGIAEEHTQRVEDRAEIGHLLGCLRTEEREALFLNCVEGFTAAEIGQLTGQPRSTVLSLLSRAKKKLAGQSNPAAEEDEQK